MKNQIRARTFGKISRHQRSSVGPASPQIPMTPAQKQDTLIKELLKEKTLFQVWRASRCIPPSTATICWTAGAATLLLLSAKLLGLAPTQMATQTRSLAELGLSFSTTVLGFLIAGFTIFASLGKAEMFRRMAETPHENYDITGFSFLKDSFLRLLRVFFEYWMFTLLCLGVKLFAYSDGPLSRSIAMLPSSAGNAKAFICIAGYTIMGASFVYVLMILQSFIFNIHHVVMIGVTWDIKVQQQEEERKKLQQPSSNAQHDSKTQA